MLIGSILTLLSSMPNFLYSDSGSENAPPPKAAPPPHHKPEPQPVEDCTFLSCPKLSFYVTGEWLYWKFTEGGTEYAVNYGDPDALVPDPDLPNARAEQVNFNWKSGFRVGAGFHFAEKGWDLYVSYSQIKPQGHSSTTASATGNVFPLLSYQDDLDLTTVTSANANWNINFKVIDFEIGRKYFISKTLSLKPQFGLKAAMINQHLHVNYNNDNPLIYTIPVGESNSLLEQNDFRGIGLRAGINSLWLMGAGFSFYGKMTGALLVSRIKTHQTQNQFVDGTSVPNIDIKSQFHPLLPVAELSFGLEWAQCFSQDRFRLALNVGFEGQYWWKQNYLEHFVGSSLAYVRPTEDLGLYGLTLGGRLDF